MINTEYNEPDTPIWNKTGFMHKQRYQFAARFVNGKKVLNIGCGPGYAEEILLQFNPEKIVSIDYDGELIQQLKKKYKNEKLIYKQFDAEELSGLNERFDILISFENIEHLRNSDRFLNSIKNVINENSILLISTPNAIHYSRRPGSNYCNPYHIQEWDYKEFLELLRPHAKSIQTFGQIIQYEEEAFQIIENAIRDLNSLWIVRLEKSIRRLINANSIRKFNFLPLFTEVKPIDEFNWEQANTFLFCARF